MKHIITLHLMLVAFIGVTFSQNESQQVLNIVKTFGTYQYQIKEGEQASVYKIDPSPIKGISFIPGQFMDINFSGQIYRLVCGQTILGIETYYFDDSKNCRFKFAANIYRSNGQFKYIDLIDMIEDRYYMVMPEEMDYKVIQKL